MVKRRFRTLLWIVFIAIFSFPFFYPESVTSQTESSYYPSTLTLVNETQYVSGSVSDLQFSDGVEMVFQSYPSLFSPATMYTQEETITIAGTEYYTVSDMADSAGTNLSAPLSSPGRSLLGKIVYPLAGVTSIPSSTWTIYYRALLSNVSEESSLNSPSGVPNALWGNPQYAYSSDNMYSTASNPGIAQQYGNYGFNLPPTANIAKVEVGYEAYTIDNEGIRVELSWNGGVEWTEAYDSPSLDVSDPDTVNWVDLTTAANWTASALSDTNFRSRVTVIKIGPTTGDVLLDWLPVRVTYVSPPSAHMDANILIRESDGAIRQTLAVNVANSEVLSETVQTLNGTYDWPAYSVVDETDYLEVDFYIDVLSTDPDVVAQLMIDYATLVAADQTRVDNILLPSENTVEVELSGSSDAGNWSKLVWNTGTSWTTDSVLVTLQLYDYLQGTYPTSGDGHIAFQSSSIPNSDEIKTQTITTNAAHFRDDSGNWKMRIKGIKPATSQFSLKLDSTTYQATPFVPNDNTVLDVYHDVAVLDVTYSPTNIHIGDIVEINVTVKNEGEAPESFNVTTSYNDKQIAKQSVENLTSNESILLTFDWNTTGMTPEAYTLKATLDTVPNEGDTTDNIFIYGGFVNLLSPENNGSSLPPWNWAWGLLSVPFLILLSAVGIRWKKRKNKLESVGFEFFNEITEGGIPNSFSVMLVGGPDSGKSVLFQELVNVFLKMEKLCVYVTYECFPDEIRENMKKFQWDTSPYENQGKLSFIDCFSSSAKVQSKEKWFLAQPFSLVDLGIIISKATNEAGNGVKIFLDSIVSLLTQLDPSMVVDFLQDRIIRVKGVQGNFIFTLNKESLDPALMSQLEETVDCIIELDANSVKGENIRKLRIKKMRGRNASNKWVQFEISPEKGVVFPI